MISHSMNPPAKQKERLAFLRSYDPIASVPSLDDDITDAGRAALDQVVARMKHAGLYARASVDADCRWGVRTLVQQLRRQR